MIKATLGRETVYLELGHNGVRKAGVGFQDLPEKLWTLDESVSPSTQGNRKVREALGGYGELGKLWDLRPHTGLDQDLGGLATSSALTWKVSLRRPHQCQGQGRRGLRWPTSTRMLSLSTCGLMGAGPLSVKAPAPGSSWLRSSCLHSPSARDSSESRVQGRWRYRGEAEKEWVPLLWSPLWMLCQWAAGGCSVTRLSQKLRPGKQRCNSAPGLHTGAPGVTLGVGSADVWGRRKRVFLLSR